jgi:putative Mg2+ transporter-C (MgtC) family protein
LPDVGWLEVVGRLLLAAVLGGAVGLERELHEREAGLRTHLLVAVGAALFTLVSAYAWHDFQFSRAGGVTFDPTRIAAQIVTGIGFLGAGAIIRQGASIRGLTTAATLWVVAAIGLSAGAGYYAAAVATTVIVLASLWPLRVLTSRLIARTRGAEERLVVELPPRSGVSAVLAALERAGGRVGSFRVEPGEGGNTRVEVYVRAPGDRRGQVAEEVSRVEGAQEVRWGR